MAYGFGTSKKVDTRTEMEKLASRNENIVSVFARTVQDLKDVNFDMELVKERKLAEVEALNAEIATLNTTQGTNANVIVKINEFLS